MFSIERCPCPDFLFDFFVHLRNKRNKTTVVSSAATLADMLLNLAGFSHSSCKILILAVRWFSSRVDRFNS